MASMPIAFSKSASDNGSSSEGNCSCCESRVGNASGIVTELKGDEKNKARAEALRNDEVKELRSMLLERGYKPKVDDAIAYEIADAQALVVEIPLEKDPASDIAKIIFATNGEKTKAGAAIIKKVDANIVIVEGFEFVDGSVVSHIVVNNNGVITLNGQKVAEIHSSSCNICLTVCYYIYAAGCTLSGYFICLGACLPFGWWACGPICAVVWALICVYGASQNCPLLCKAGGFC